MQNKEHPHRHEKLCRVAHEVLGWLGRLALAVVIAQLVHLLIFQPVRVQGESMRDTLNDGEVMYVSKPEYLLGDPGRGDVVICKYPGRTENFVKRVMGVPGDTIEIISNVVYRNGTALREPYLTPWRNDSGFAMEAFTLGENEYFVMGDNRDNSHDSRNYHGYGAPAAIAREMIIGRVRLVMWPLDAIREVE